MRFFQAPKWLIALIGILYVAAFFIGNRWPTLAHTGDAWGYYAHLPSVLLYSDVGNYDKTIAATAANSPGYVDPRIDKYGIRTTPTGKYIIKYPVGVAILEAPFFGIAHILTKLDDGTYAPDGFSRPYMLWTGLSGIFYVLLGFFLLWKILNRYFPAAVSRTLILLLAFGTNLFYFSVYNNLMSHSFLFFLHAAVIWASIRFWERQTLINAVMVGAAVGFVAITRTQELIIAAVPVLWGLTGWSSVRERLLFFRQNWKWPAIAALAFFLTALPQLWYWKAVSGSWVYFSYQGETFDFRHPHIWQGLTSFRNGWLVYTPVMLLALAGLFRLRKVTPDAWWPFWVFFPLHLYVTYSWWCWYYINGLGSRPMVETYALLALPLGAFWTWGRQHAWKKVFNWAVFLFVVWLNIFQTWQLREGILWSENGNKAYYQAIFGTLHPDRNALIAYDSGERQPDEPLFKVRDLAMLNFEDTTVESHTAELAFSGRSCLLATDEFSANALFTGDSRELKPGNWISIGCQAFVRKNDKIWDYYQMAMLTLEFTDREDNHIKSRRIRISSKIWNPDHSIWSTGDTDRWGEARFFVRIPRHFPADGKIKAYIWNPHHQKLYVDDLQVSLWQTFESR
ncbi:MAG: hypothetical protein EP344_18435 [Bacteroidetes bacterium]|nr:MAG: hypothetical protein EP344_18435 [Bacteroidota bacterium]